MRWLIAIAVTKMLHEAEVGKLDVTAARQQHVIGLNVTVQDVARVQVCERRCYPVRDTA